MKKIIITLLGATSILFSTIVASQSFEGFSVGVNISTADFDIKGREFEVDSNTGDAHETSAFVKRSVSTDILEGFIEYTFAQGSTIGIAMVPDKATFNAETRAVTPTATGEGDSGTQTVKASVSDHTLYYAEPTYMLGEKFGVYVKAGVAEVTVKSEETLATNSTYGDQDVWGVMTGYGAKYYMGNFFVKAEYTETEYGKIMLTSTTGNKNIIEADIDSDKTTIAVGYNF
mgnify:FL=1